MKNNLSFSDYLKSKETLREAKKSDKQVYHFYEVSKYCKIPVYEKQHGEYVEEKTYVSLKPKDRIKVLWEYLSNDSEPIIKALTICEDDVEAQFAWNDSKIIRWIESTTHEKL